MWELVGCPTITFLVMPRTMFVSPVAAPRRRGFSMLELVFVIALLGAVVAIGVRRLGSTLAHDRLGKAANVFASDVELAFSLAARQRVPVRLTVDSARRRYVLSDATDGGMVYKVRDLSAGEREVGYLSFSRGVLDITPSGFATDTLRAVFGMSEPRGRYEKVVRVQRSGLLVIR